MEFWNFALSYGCSYPFQTRANQIEPLFKLKSVTLPTLRPKQGFETGTFSIVASVIITRQAGSHHHNLKQHINYPLSSLFWAPAAYYYRVLIILTLIEVSSQLRVLKNQVNHVLVHFFYDQTIHLRGKFYTV